MSDENFRSVMMGYHKEDVKNYIDTLVIDNRRIIKSKEDNILSLQKKVNELEIQLTRMKEIENQCIGSNEKVKIVSQEVQSKDSEIQRLRLELDEALVRLNEIPKEPVVSMEEIRLRDEVLAMKAENEKLRYELNAKNNSAEEAEKILVELRNEYAEIEQKYSESTNSEQALRVKLNQFVEDLKNIQQENNELVESMESAKLEANDCRAEIEKLKLQYAESEEIAINIRAREAALEHDRGLIAKALLSAEEKAEDMKLELEKKYAELNHELNEKYQNENEKFQAYKAEVDSFRKNVLEMIARFDVDLVKEVESSVSIDEVFEDFHGMKPDEDEIEESISSEDDIHNALMED